MARDEDDDDGLPPLGENTEKFLEQAKKGQARNFLLVCKGTKVNYLAVSKKPVKKNELNEAKKAGYKGDGYFGVITGKGMELVFNLSTADGYTAEPVKDKILKDFLEEKADFKCKPTISIVATLPEIPFDEEDLSHPLIAKFMKLELVIAKALDIHPARAEELQKAVMEIRILLQDEEKRDSADGKIQSVTQFLRELLATKPIANSKAPSSDSTSSSTPNSEKQGTEEETGKKQAETLKKLKGDVDRILNALPDLKSDLFTKVARIANEIKSKLFEVAHSSLSDFANELEKLASAAKPEDDDDVTTELVKFRERQMELEPQLKELRKKLPERMSELDIIWTYAAVQVDAGNFNNAHKALGRLAQRSDSLKEEVEFLAAMSMTEDLLGNESEEAMQPLLADQANQIVEMLDKIVVPSERDSDVKRIETARATVLDSLNNVGLTPTQIGVARTNLDSYRQLIVEIREGLDRDAKSILEKLKEVTQPNGIDSDEWRGVRELCEFVRSAVDVEAPYSADVDAAAESVEKIPEAVEVSRLLGLSRKNYETAKNEIPKSILGAVELKLVDDSTIEAYEKARFSALQEPTNKKLAEDLTDASNEAVLQIGKLIGQVFTQQWESATFSASKECRESLLRIPASIIREFFSTTVRDDASYKDFQQYSKLEATPENYSSRVNDLNSKKQKAISFIDTLVKDYEERLRRTNEAKIRYQVLVTNLTTDEIASVTTVVENALPIITDLDNFGIAMDGFDTRINRTADLKLGITTLRNNLNTFQQQTCALKSGDSILKMLGELEIAVKSGEPTDEKLSEWENLLSKRNEAFTRGKTDVEKARANVTSGVSYLKSLNVVGRGTGKNLRKTDVEWHLGPQSGASVADWGYEWNDLLTEIRESFKDGFMTQSEFDNALTKSGQQNYIYSGDLHISVVCKKVNSLWQVTGVHVTPENSFPEKGKPHYWYTVDGGKLTPQVSTREKPNPSGTPSRMPPNFVANAAALVRKKAGSINCRT